MYDRLILSHDVRKSAESSSAISYKNRIATSSGLCQRTRVVLFHIVAHLMVILLPIGKIPSDTGGYVWWYKKIKLFVLPELASTLVKEWTRKR